MSQRLYLLLVAAAFCFAQAPPSRHLALPTAGPVLAGPTESNKPFSVVGEWGAVLGEQGGVFESWAFPVKILSHVRLEARVDDYPVPINVNAQAAHFETHPGLSTITYAHAAFTIRQHMVAPRTPAPAAPLVFFEIDSIRPLTLTVRFAPEMQRMWPAPVYGLPNAGWDEAEGFYILYTDSPKLFGGVSLAGAKPGILAPYQERPRTYPTEFVLRFDPRRDKGSWIPLVVAAGDSRDEVIAKLRTANENAAAWFRQTQDYYDGLLNRLTAIETPDPRFNDAFRWALVALDQMRIRHGGETGLAAGFYVSADSARPGFGWFFGRDTLWSLFAVNAAGHFAATREALDFLIQRQRADGKIMHEYSQSAPFVDWPSLPYFYASADATPLLPMALDDYVRASGDIDFLRRHWDAARKAYGFVRGHDSNGDGVYENTEGHGWVESWPPRMPFQELYLAALDEQMCLSMASMALLVNDAELAREAAGHADAIGRQVAAYRDAASDFYRFSRNRDGSYDATATIFPAVAWWTGRAMPAGGAAMFRRWAADEFSTDWGTRAVGGSEKIFDPISYHQGSVWPLFTGWVSLAEYRAGRAAAGFQHLMQNALLTYTQDQGAVTELLSGAYFQPLGRSSSRQMWSSAMVVAPALKGLFGIDADVPHRQLRVLPHLPASWNGAAVRRAPFGDAALDIELRREGVEMLVTVASAKPLSLCLNAADSASNCQAAPARRWETRVPLPAIEIEAPSTLPAPGARTAQAKVLDVAISARSADIVLEAQEGSEVTLRCRLNRPGARFSSATLRGESLLVSVPGSGGGYRTLTVRAEW